MKTLREIIDATVAAIYQYNGVDVPDEVISRVELDMTTPSPISDQAALLHRLNDATKPVDAADRNLIIRALSIVPTTGSAPEYIATLPADWHVDSSLATWFPLTADELESTKRMFHDACHDLGLINEALGLDPDDGGAAPILDAIAELKGTRPIEPVMMEAQMQVLITNTIGFGFDAGELQTVNADDLKRLAGALLAASMGGEKS